MQSALCKSSTNWLFSIAMFDCQRVLNKVVFAPYLRLGKIKWTLVARKGLPFWNLKGNGQRQVFASKVTLDLSAFWLIPKLFVRKDSHMCVGDMNQFLIILVGEVKFWRVWHVSDLGNGVRVWLHGLQDTSTYIYTWSFSFLFLFFLGS